jgi:hypothetical protein
MTPPNNPFAVLLSSIQKKLAPSRTFIGVIVDKKGFISILKDETTRKFIWYSSCATLYSEFINRMQNNQYKECTFYAISATNYASNKLLINLYDGASIKVTPEEFVVFDAIELNFHKKASIGMFMPLKFNLDALYEKIKNDPSRLFEASVKAKDLVFSESKPCTSCGVVCHVPDITTQPGISNSAIKDILNVTSENRYFCFECGRAMLISAAKHKMADCTDLQKINKVKNLVIELEKCVLSGSNFEFEKTQNIMKELLSCISKSRMTVVNNNQVTEQKNNAAATPTKLTKPEEISPWMN